MSKYMELLDHPIKHHRKPKYMEKNLCMKRSLPFYESGARVRVKTHRVRELTIIRNRQGESSHAAVRLWCGQGGFVSLRGGKDGYLLPVFAEGDFCKNCDAKAIAAGKSSITTLKREHCS